MKIRYFLMSAAVLVFTLLLPINQASAYTAVTLLCSDPMDKAASLSLLKKSTDNCDYNVFTDSIFYKNTSYSGWSLKSSSQVLPQCFQKKDIIASSVYTGGYGEIRLTCKASGKSRLKGYSDYTYPVTINFDKKLYKDYWPGGCKITMDKLGFVCYK